MKKRNLTNAEYHANKTHISASGLKMIAKKSVYHYLNQEPFSSTAMNLGSAIHTTLLEPQNFDKEFFRMPKIDLRTKDGKEQKKELQKIAGDRILLKDSELEILDGIKSNFEKDDLAKFYCQGEIESSYFGEINGVKVRVRPDVYNGLLKFISDVKSCQDNSPQAFKKDCYKYGYPLQAVCYSTLMGIDPKQFRFIAVETKYPFSCQVYALSDEMIEYGKKQLEKALADWKFYLTTKKADLYQGYNLTEDGSIIL